MARLKTIKNKALLNQSPMGRNDQPNVLITWSRKKKYPVAAITITPIANHTLAGNPTTNALVNWIKVLVMCVIFAITFLPDALVVDFLVEKFIRQWQL